jgi:DNA-binding response OmpR family regulator
MPTKKILIADDEPDILSVLEKKLRQSNFIVLALSQGKEIVEKVKSFHPDLLVLDIIMPDSDGYLVARALRDDQTLPKIPVIFMTGKELDYSGIMKRISELGSCDFIAKPCAFEELLEKIKKAIGPQNQNEQIPQK